MTGRLAAKLLVNALIRRVNQSGGFATIIARGEDSGGMILVQTLDKGQFSGFFERMTDWHGMVTLVRCGPNCASDPSTIGNYIERRQRSDPDLWIVELDIADAERFAAETIATG